MANVGAYVPKDVVVEAVNWDPKNIFIQQSAIEVLLKRHVAFAIEHQGYITVIDKKGNESKLRGEGKIVFDSDTSGYVMLNDKFNETYTRLEEPF